MFLQQSDFISHGYILNSEITESCGSSVFSFLRSLYIIFHSDCKFPFLETAWTGPKVGRQKLNPLSFVGVRNPVTKSRSQSWY